MNVLVVDRDEVKTSIFTVDVGNEFAHKTLEFRRISQGGARHLDHDNVADPFRVVLKQFFERTKLKARTFRQMLGERRGGQ